MPKDDTTVLVLLSGGVDSTALICHYLTQGLNVRAVHFQYGQPAEAAELHAASLIAQHYGIPISTIRLGIQLNARGGEIFCRNALFVLAALAGVEPLHKTVSLGIHSGSPYYDCSEHFVDDLQRLLDGYFAGVVRLDTPFLLWTKKEIFAFCEEHRVPVNLTFSCERQSVRACGQCPSCKERERYYANR